MEFPALRGRSILLVEDEVLIGMDIRNALEEAGAQVTATTTVRHALSTTTAWQGQSLITHSLTETARSFAHD